MTIISPYSYSVDNRPNSMLLTRLPTLSEIEALTAFLPRLYADGFSPVVHWDGGQKNNDGLLSLPYPQYDPLVEDFFHLLGSECWLDYGYDPAQAWAVLQDEARVKVASLSEVKTMLTFCVRGERFSDGHWAEMIQRGHIRRLLERLNVIKSEMAAKK